MTNNLIYIQTAVDAVNKRIKQIGYENNALVLSIRQAVREVKPVDAVLVVRCKDCRWGREVCGNIECFVDRNIPPEYHSYDWFCPNGERKERGSNG